MHMLYKCLLVPKLIVITNIKMFSLQGRGDSLGVQCLGFIPTLQNNKLCSW